jgi:predicted Zn-dependent peptidase
MLKEPTFSKTELTRIKLTTVNEIKESKENSKAIAKEELRNSIYGLHDRRYTNDEDTLIKQIATITPKHLQKLHAKFLVDVWTCTQASGKPEIELFKQMIIKCNHAKGAEEPLRIHQQKPPQPGLTLRDIPSRQNIDFSIGAPLPITMHHPDYVPLMFGITVLGKLGGFTGRLMSTVREQEGLTYGIYASPESFYLEEQGYWRIMTFFSPKQALQGLTSTFREVNKIYNEGITKEELHKFKKILKTGQALKNDSTASLLSELHAYHSQQFTLNEMEEYRNRILNVSLKEVNDAIKTYLNPSTLTISGAGPVKSVKKELQAFIKTVS